MSASATITIREKAPVKPVFSKAGLKNYLRGRTRVDESVEVAGYCYMNDDLHLILKIKNSIPEQDKEPANKQKSDFGPYSQTDGLAQLGKDIFKIWAKY